MSDEYEPVSLGEGKCTHHTTNLGNKRTGSGEGALHVTLEEDGRKIWIPKSVIHDDSEVFDLGHEGDVIVQHWYAEKKGFL